MKKAFSLFSIITLVFSLFLFYNLQRLLDFDLNIVIDLKQAKLGEITATTFYNNGSTGKLKFDNNKFSGKVIVSNEEEEASLELKLDRDLSKVNEGLFNGLPIKDDNIVNYASIVGPSYGKDPYFQYHVIKIPRDHKAPYLWVIVALFFWYLVIFKLKNNKLLGPPIIRDLTYSGTVFRYLSRKDYLIFFATFLVTSFITVGCDAILMIKALNPLLYGVDPYQFQVSHKSLLHYYFINWPYNPLFTVIYTFFSSPWALLTANAPFIWGYEHIQMIGMKSFNFLLHLTLTFSLLSFALDKKLIKMSSLKSIMYLYFFNPLVFYVTVIFLQLDILPLYLITIGLLTLSEDKPRIIASSLLLGMGLSCKLQNLLILPEVALGSILILGFLPIGERCFNRIKNLCIHLAGILLIVFLLNAPFYKTNKAFYHLIKNFDQTSRLWSTTLVYAEGGLYLYLTFSIIVLLFLLHSSYFHLKLQAFEVTVNIFLFIGALILGFSALHMNTPSTLVQTGSALFFLFCFSNDNFKRGFLFITSSLMLTSVMFNDVGDISRVFGWTNSPISELYRAMAPDVKVRYSSFLFTIANTSMLAFSLIMLKESIARLKEIKNP